MKKVNVYLMSDIQTIKKRSGHVIYILEYGKTTLTNTEEISQASAGGAELMGAVFALRRIREPCQLTIWLEKAYLPNNLLRNVWIWKDRGWNTAAGRPVAYAEFWREFIELLTKHEHEVYKGLDHPFRNWMKNELEHSKFSIGAAI